MSKREATRSPRSRQSFFEGLEERWAPAVFNVPAEMGLPAAITAAEAPGADKVNTINVAPGT
ncbi:MAG: hypothetical protein ACLQNE_11915 [Thermoguttaceae bacterium]